MKTNIAKKIVNEIDRSIPDTNVEEAKEYGKRIAKNTAGAAICWAEMYICIAFAVTDAAELSVKGTKTLIKHAGIKAKQFYEDRTPMMVVYK